ncbi:MAG: peptide chain release factor N(5)-glutamine methyltransferase [Eubacteriales bacterium]
MTYQEAYTNGMIILSEYGICNAKLDARLLLEYVGQLSLHDIFAHGERELSEELWKSYEGLLHERGTHVPLQYLTGEQEFMGLSFVVNKHVLIPRQDTEFLVEEGLLHIYDGMKLLDICTGSGCILLSAMHYKNDCSGVGVDISKMALEVARTNAKNLGIQAEFMESDLLEKVQGKFDVVFSNPPYIRSELIDTLMEEVRDHEPRLALDGLEDGLFFYRRIVDGVRQHMNRGGYLLLEIGHDQSVSVSHLMEKAGFTHVEVQKDYAGNDRVVKGMYIE